MAVPLVEFMRSMTQREYEARLAWLEKEEDVPSRADWYAMQVAAEVRRTRVKDPSTVRLKDLKLAMEEPPRPRPVTRREAAKAAMARWAGMLGIGRR